MSSAMRPATRRVPTLDELRELTAEPDERVVFRGVDWDFYERMADAIPEGAGVHVDFDGEDLEVMVLGLPHDFTRKLLGQFVETVAQELAIPYKSAGQTTWKRPEIRRGLESDESYFFRPEKLAAVARARARGSADLADYPNPDLAIEVDESPPKVDRAGIYAAMAVVEVWRFDRGIVLIDRLTDEGTYRVVEASGLLPVAAEEVRRWIVEEDSDDESAWARRLREWAGAELRPRLGR